MDQESQNPGSSGSDFFEEKKCDIFLRIYFHTIPSQEIKIVGNIPELGSWNLSNSFPMNTDSEMYPYWLNLKPLKVAKNTNIEFKIVIFENGNFKDWEKLPNNGNRYHFIKFSKVCLEMKEFVAEVRERPVAKYDSDSELKIPENVIWRKKGIVKKICPFDLARETDSENSSDKISDLIGDAMGQHYLDSSSFMSASKSLSESQSDFDNENDFNENKAPLKQQNKLLKANPVQELKENKNEFNFQEIYNKYIKNRFRSSKKKLSQNIIKPIPSILNLLSKRSNNLPNFEDVFIIMSFFSPISIKKSKTIQEGDQKWIIKPIFDVFYTHFYNYLIRSSQKFYWFCWSGLSLPLNEQRELSKFLEDNYKIIPIFLDSMKIQNFIENFSYKRMKPACHNLYDLFSSDIDLDDTDLTTYNEINKNFASEALKFLNKNTKKSEKKNFIILNYHLFKVPFYLRKSILKANKIYSPFYHNISVYFNSGFPNHNNIKILGDYKKFLFSLLFSDLLIFSIHDHAINFCLNCQNYLQISYKMNDGGRIYLEFESKIIAINILHPYIDFPLKDLSKSLNFHQNNKKCSLEEVYEKYQNHIIILSMDEIYENAMFEMKFHAFKMFCQKQKNKKMVLVQFLYDSFELCYIKRVEYYEKLSQLTESINNEIGENQIELIYGNKFNIESRNKIFKKTSIFLKLSLIRDENYLHHLQYLSVNDDAVTILSANLFQTKAFKSIMTINSLNINSIQQSFNKALEILHTQTQKCFVFIDRVYLQSNNLSKWFNYNYNSLTVFNYYNDKEFKLTHDKVNPEENDCRLMVPTAEFEELDIKNIVSSYKKSQNSVFIFEFEGVFFDVNLLNNVLATNNILEIDAKLSKCKPLPIINEEILMSLKKIVQDPRNSVYIVSSIAHEKLAFFFPDMTGLTLFSENGYICQKIGRDDSPFINFYEKADTSWKAIVQTVIMEYVMKTKGSYLIEKKYSLIWIFDKVDKDFAAIQAKELMEHLNDVLEFIDVIEIAQYENFIEVRLKNCQKGVCSIMGIYESFFAKNSSVDMFLCVSGGKEFSSDLLKANKTLQKNYDQIFSDDVSFFNCVIDPRNCALDADYYLNDINEFNKLITALGEIEESVKETPKRQLVRGGVFKKITFEEEDFQS